MEDKFVFIKNIDNNNMLVYWLGTYELIEIPKPKFFDGQFVKSSGKHYSQKSFTRLLYPTYTKEQGWVYVENSVDREGNGSGCGMWNDEFQYESLTDPLDILIAQRLYTEFELKKLDSKSQELKSKLDELNHCIDIINTSLKVGA